MKLFRAFAVGAASLGCALAISLFIWVFTLQATIFNREVVKGWLRDSNVYSKVIGGVVQTDPRVQQASSTLLTPDVVKNALSQTYTPAYIQTESEKAIDSVFDWIDGTKSQPSFSVPIDEKKTTLVNQLAVALEPGVIQLPVCTALSQFNTADPTCRPPTMTATQFAREIAVKAVEQSKLAEAPITEQTLSQNQTSETGKQDSALFNRLPSYRQWIQWLLVALPIVVVACLLIITLAAVDRLRSFAHLCRRIFVGSLLTFLVSLGLLYLGSNPAMIPGFDNAGIATAVFLPVVQKATMSIGQLLATISGIVALVSGLSGLTMWFVRRKQLTHTPVAAATPSAEPTTNPTQTASSDKQSKQPDDQPRP